jgi:hypothetical protein
MSDLKKAAQQALAHVQEFKRRWMAVPPFGNKVNEATREAVTLAHAPVLQLEEDLRTALAQQEECRWLQDGDKESSTWQASCSRRYFMLVDGTPTDNRMSHCCYCGKKLVEVPIEQEDDHE